MSIKKTYIDNSKQNLSNFYNKMINDSFEVS